MNRRQFLRGAGGATVAIPLLASLEPARANPLGAPKRFLCLATPHGGIWEEHMWPDTAGMTDQLDIGHTIHRGDLVATTDGSDAVLSDVLRADASRFTPDIVAEMNLLRGLDIPFYISHHTGGHLGNYGRNDGEFEGLNNLPYQPTIDQIMAWSTGFLGDTSGMVRRSVHVGNEISYGWANPSQPGGAVDPMPLEWSNLWLFDELFGNAPVDPEEPRRLVVDKVLESYRRLREGAFGPARRLSNGDRARLDAHMERLYEVERKLTAVADCGDLERPTIDTGGHPGEWYGSQDLGLAVEFYQLWNEVIALGAICGATRIATLYGHHPMNIYGGDWHQDVAHEAWVDGTAEGRIVSGQQEFFENVFVDLCHRLNVADCDGNTVLHNSLVLWNHESGSLTHDNWSTPTITAGSFGGAISTGNYCDYRDRNDTQWIDPSNAVASLIRPGLLYSQFLASMLRASGVSDSEWITANNPGYGVWYNERAVPQYVQAMANDMLPFLAP